MKILTLLHSERPQLYAVLAFWSVIGLQMCRLHLGLYVWILNVQTASQALCLDR